MHGIDSSKRNRATEDSGRNVGGTLRWHFSVGLTVPLGPPQKRHTDLSISSERNDDMDNISSSPLNIITPQNRGAFDNPAKLQYGMRNDTPQALVHSFSTPSSVHNSSSLEGGGHSSTAAINDAVESDSTTSSLAVSINSESMPHDLERGRNQSVPNITLVPKASRSSLSVAPNMMTATTQLQNNTTNEVVASPSSSSSVQPVKNFTNFFSHIPKSGSEYAFSTLMDMLSTDPKWLALPKRKFSRYRACNEGKTTVRKFHLRYSYSYNEHYCNLWMSESRYTSEPKKIYTIVREPREHVLSMYFHCAESKDHASMANRMKNNLTAWLEAWVAGIDNKTKRVENKEFLCYKPIEHQTKWTAFDPDKGKEELRQKWTILGDNRQMTKSICMIYIRWNGWVPGQCDCTNGTSLEQRQTIDGANSSDNFDHGVTHHGATYTTTPYQDELIGKLRGNDTILYKLTQEIMEEQQREIEAEFNVKLCDNFQKLA